MNTGENWNNSPLAGGARILRGFRRIGVALAVASLLVGAVSTIWAAIYQRADIHARYNQASCIVTMVSQKRMLTMDSYWKDRVDMTASGCPGPGYAKTLNEIWPIAQNEPAFFEGAGEPLAIGTTLTLVFATFFYFFFWAIGWVIAGFARD